MHALPVTSAATGLPLPVTCPAPDTEPQPQSLGSGVIVDAKNGYVITNSHGRKFL